MAVSTFVLKPASVSLNNFDDNELKEHESQVTPQHVIDRLSRYVIRPKGAYSASSCNLCYLKYKVGDRTVCFPCQHNFHEYCIENWLKWVKPTCPVDKKSVVRFKYLDEIAEEKRLQVIDDIFVKELQLHDRNFSKESAGQGSDNEEISFSYSSARSIEDEAQSREKATSKETKIIIPSDKRANRKSGSGKCSAVNLWNLKKVDNVPNILSVQLKKISKRQSPQSQQVKDSNETNVGSLVVREAIESTMKKLSNVNISSSESADVCSDSPTICVKNEIRSLKYYKKENESSPRFGGEELILGGRAKKHKTFMDLVFQKKDKREGWVYCSSRKISSCKK